MRGYVSSEGLFVCPVAPELRCGYGMNASVRGMGLEALHTPNEMAMLFDATGGWASSGSTLEPRDERGLRRQPRQMDTGHEPGRADVVAIARGPATSSHSVGFRNRRKTW
jgi:hypothetical protein